MRWRPVPKGDISELAGPTKWMMPRGLLLAKPGKQMPFHDSSAGIECGTCHRVIYRAEGDFDREAFYAARKKHYSVSPECESNEVEYHSKR